MRTVSNDGHISVNITFGMFAELLIKGENWLEAAMADLRGNIEPDLDVDSQGQLVIRGWFSDIDSRVEIDVEQHIKDRFGFGWDGSQEPFENEQSEALAVQIVTQFEYLARVFRMDLDRRLAANKNENNRV